MPDPPAMPGMAGARFVGGWDRSASPMIPTFPVAEEPDTRPPAVVGDERDRGDESA